MEIWDHKFVYFKGNPFIDESSDPQVNALLAQYGAEGWQLVSHAPNERTKDGQWVTSLTFTFRRPRRR
ncbi:DUF4177 domain-containing protein [Streptomyces humi]|uniref:DUF4177 domain-containing protein n=1 Tax=Streptomyces humi TaxID=1428620 RepID=UPI001160C80F|nr:DUF4177 domain-containing protein [Streptomyces humi]